MGKPVKKVGERGAYETHPIRAKSIDNESLRVPRSLSAFGCVRLNFFDRCFVIRCDPRSHSVESEVRIQVLLALIERRLAVTLQIPR